MFTDVFERPGVFVYLRPGKNYHKLPIRFGFIADALIGDVSNRCFAVEDIRFRSGADIKIDHLPSDRLLGGLVAAVMDTILLIC